MLELMDRHIAAQTMADLGGVHARTGCLRDAISCYERSLACMREVGNRHGEARTLAGLAGVYLRDGRREDAIDCYESCLAILREHRDHHGETQTLCDLQVAMREFDGVPNQPA
jgi:tetratricopeptide (TPR) repeat protein